MQSPFAGRLRLSLRDEHFLARMVVRGMVEGGFQHPVRGITSDVYDDHFVFIPRFEDSSSGGQ